MPSDPNLKIIGLRVGGVLLMGVVVAVILGVMSSLSWQINAIVAAAAAALWAYRYERQ